MCAPMQQQGSSSRRIRRAQAQARPWRSTQRGGGSAGAQRLQLRLCAHEMHSFQGVCAEQHEVKLRCLRCGSTRRRHRRRRQRLSSAHGFRACLLSAASNRTLRRAWAWRAACHCMARLWPLPSHLLLSLGRVGGRHGLGLLRLLLLGGLQQRTAGARRSANAQRAWRSLGKPGALTMVTRRLKRASRARWAP